MAYHAHRRFDVYLCDSKSYNSCFALVYLRARVLSLSFSLSIDFLWRAPSPSIFRHAHDIYMRIEHKTDAVQARRRRGYATQKKLNISFLMLPVKLLTNTNKPTETPIPIAHLIRNAYPAPHHTVFPDSQTKATAQHNAAREKWLAASRARQISRDWVSQHAIIYVYS